MDPLEITSRISQWFSVIPKAFRPEDVQTAVTDLKASPEDILLDPFAGECTTLIYAQAEGIGALGFELNPFLVFAGGAMLNWRIDAEAAADLLPKLLSSGRSGTAKLLGGKPVLSRVDPFKWWRQDVLDDLRSCEFAIHSLCTDPGVKDFYLLALAAAMIPEMANVSLIDHQIKLVKREEETIDVFGAFQRRAEKMLADLSSLDPALRHRRTRVTIQDSTQMPTGPAMDKISLIVTSPPYPNRYSYTWNTMPHLFFFGLLETQEWAADLDRRSIGGTWGHATTSLAKNKVEIENPIVAEAVSPLLAEYRDTSPILGNYLARYFNFLGRHLQQLAQFSHLNLRVAYLVGRPILSETAVNVDLILARILEGLDLGLEVTDIKGLGCRYPRQGIEEFLVYAARR